MSPKKKILIIDDEREILIVLAEYLMDEGYEVSTASNGWKALDIFADFKPDLVLSDNMMPLISGMDVYKKFRELPGFLTTPFIIMSSAPLRLTENCHAPTDYVRKPFDASQILQVIQKYI